MASSDLLLFVYGTLMTGEVNGAQMQGARYLGPARTAPGWCLYQLDGYPGMVALAGAEGVEGELWSVPPSVVARLDVFEGVDEGLYRREALPLHVAPVPGEAQAYVYLGEVRGCRSLGASWRRR